MIATMVTVYREFTEFEKQVHIEILTWAIDNELTFEDQRSMYRAYWKEYLDEIYSN